MAVDGQDIYWADPHSNRIGRPPSTPRRDAGVITGAGSPSVSPRRSGRSTLGVDLRARRRVQLPAGDRGQRQLLVRPREPAARSSRARQGARVPCPRADDRHRRARAHWFTVTATDTDGQTAAVTAEIPSPAARRGPRRPRLRSWLPETELTIGRGQSSTRAIRCQAGLGGGI